jgi:hypothetical protein
VAVKITGDRTQPGNVGSIQSRMWLRHAEKRLFRLEESIVCHGSLAAEFQYL